jgi:hypothetical protein
MTDKKLDPFFTHLIPVTQLTYKEYEDIVEHHNPIYKLYSTYPNIENHIKSLYNLGVDYNNVRVTIQEITGDNLDDTGFILNIIVKFKCSGRGNKTKNLERYIKDHRVLETWSTYSEFINDNIEDELEESMDFTLKYE